MILDLKKLFDGLVREEMDKHLKAMDAAIRADNMNQASFHCGKKDAYSNALSLFNEAVRKLDTDDMEDEEEDGKTKD